jgi:hypothetical protein
MERKETAAMVPKPVALGLTLCEKVIVEDGTKSVSLIGIFSKVRGRTFPLALPPVWVAATLTGSQGEGELSLSVTNLQTDEEQHLLTERIVFPDRFAEIQKYLRLNTFVFPEPGEYMITLMVDDDWVAQRRVIIRELESAS